LPADWVEPGVPDGELTLELVPGLLDGVVLADDPVVLLEPDIALFNFTAPLVSRQWVAAEMPADPAEPDAPGGVGGGELVWALAMRMLEARNSTVPNSFFDMTFLLGLPSRIL
jgi:hypothetical protein